jgi:dienelactone hydrolase
MLRLMRLLLAALGTFGFALTFAQDAKLDPSFSGTPFERYTCTDNLGRTITFYLSRASEKPLPLILLIQGSGCQSIWTKRQGKIGGGLQNLLLSAVKGKCRVLAVEKPGIDCFFQASQEGSAEGAPNAFLVEHTLPRWAEANEAAIRAAVKLPMIDSKRILALGHSEGAITAARVAAEMPQITHVGILSGSGANQLFDMALSVGEKNAFDTWAQIAQDPESTTKFAWGHPYRRWSSFCSTSTAEEIKKTSAKLFIAHGTEDKSVPYQSFEVLRAELVANNREAHFEIVDGGGHDFAKSDDDSFAPLAVMFGKVMTWFLG